MVPRGPLQWLHAPVPPRFSKSSLLAPHPPRHIDPLGGLERRHCFPRRVPAYSVPLAQDRGLHPAQHRHVGGISSEDPASPGGYQLGVLRKSERVAQGPERCGVGV